MITEIWSSGKGDEFRFSFTENLITGTLYSTESKWEPLSFCGIIMNDNDKNSFMITMDKIDSYDSFIFNGKQDKGRKISLKYLHYKNMYDHQFCPIKGEIELFRCIYIDIKIIQKNYFNSQSILANRLSQKGRMSSIFPINKSIL